MDKARKDQKIEQLSMTNEEDYVRHFGFSMEDLSFLISPNGSMSPTKKKARSNNNSNSNDNNSVSNNSNSNSHNSSFNFDNFDDITRVEDAKTCDEDDDVAPAVAASSRTGSKSSRNLLASGLGGIAPTASAPGVPAAESIDLVFEGLENEHFIKNENIFLKQIVGAGMLRKSMSFSRDEALIGREHSLEFMRLNSGDIAAFISAEDQQPVVAEVSNATASMASTTAGIAVSSSSHGKSSLYRSRSSSSGHIASGDDASMRSATKTLKPPAASSIGASSHIINNVPATGNKINDSIMRLADMEDEASLQQQLQDEYGHLVARNMEAMMQLNLLQTTSSAVPNAVNSAAGALFGFGYENTTSSTSNGSCGSSVLNSRNWATSQLSIEVADQSSAASAASTYSRDGSTAVSSSRTPISFSPVATSNAFQLTYNGDSAASFNLNSSPFAQYHQQQQQQKQQQLVQPHRQQPQQLKRQQQQQYGQQKLIPQQGFKLPADVAALTSAENVSKAASKMEISNPSNITGSIQATFAINNNSSSGADNSRISKSLATISRRFVEFYGGSSTLDYIAGIRDARDIPVCQHVTNRVDAAARSLAVHVRRIYELIKILEILSLVKFSADERGKFTWIGCNNFLLALGSIQAEAIRKNPDIAVQHGLRLFHDSPTPSTSTPDTNSPSGTPHISNNNSSAPAATATDGNQIFQSMQQQQLQQSSLLRKSLVDRQTASIAAIASAGELLDNNQQQQLQLQLQPQQKQQQLMLQEYQLQQYQLQLQQQQLVPQGQESPSSISTASTGSSHFNYLPPGGQGFHIGSSRSNSGSGTALCGISMIRGNSIGESDALNNLLDAAASSQYAAVDDKGSKKRSGVKRSSRTKSSVESTAAATVAAATLSATTAATSGSEDPQEFMAEGICRSFLSLFLLGLNELSTNFAIQRLVPMHDLSQSLSEYNRQNATKIRRVYDVCNVLCSLNLVSKVSPNNKSPVPRAAQPVGGDSSSSQLLRDVNSIGELNSLSASSSAATTAAATVAAKSDMKSDSKALIWKTFPPVLIREYYLAHKHYA